jgi:aminoglycoside 3-N-acetyltransferase
MSPLEAVSGLAYRYLSPEKFQALRMAFLFGRDKLKPLSKLVHGTFDVDELREHLQQTIGSDFEILMVHSSYNHMLPMFSGTALELVKMLVDYCGPSRTLAMPAFYFGDPKIGGAYATFKERPVFDLKRMPSQMGLATELFRRMPGVVQSRHPVYRIAALGPLAQKMVEGHELTVSPSGVGSPFDFMAQRNTRIIGIGKTYQVLTQAHHVEGVMGDAFPVPRGTGDGLEVTVIDGQQSVTARLSAQSPLWEFDIWKIRDLMPEDRLREWRFHHVPLFSTRASDVTADLLAAAKLGKTLYLRPE